MSTSERLITVGFSTAVIAAVGAFTALLFVHQYPDISGRSASQSPTAAIEVSAVELDSTVVALDDDETDEDEADEDDCGHHGAAPDSKRGSDSNAPSQMPQNKPGQTRDRIQQRNAAQLERDAVNNRRAVDNSDGQADTQTEPRAGSDRQESGLSGPAGGPSPLPPIATVPPRIVAQTPDNTVVQPETTVPQDTEEITPRSVLTTATAGGPPPPDSYRISYPPALRSADVAELAMMALPGTAGIVSLTVFGALIGYRQAKAGHSLPASGAGRFVR